MNDSTKVIRWASQTELTYEKVMTEFAKFKAGVAD